MKKKLSLAVAGLMALTLAPVNSAFALDEDYSSVQIVEESDGTATFQAIFTVEPVDTAALKEGTIGVRLLGDDVEFINKNPGDLVIDVAGGGGGVVALLAANAFDGTQQAYATFTTKPGAGDKITIKGKVKFDNAADGEYKVEYDLKDIGLIRTEKVYAKVTDKDGDFTRVTESPKKVGRGTEQRLASFEVQGKANDEITVTLPSDDFEWDVANTKVTPAPAVAFTVDGTNKRKATFKMSSTKASVTPYINVKKDAPKGDIELDVKKGDKTDTIKVGEYVDHEIKMELVKSLKEELANGDTYKVEVKVKTTDKDTLPKYIDFESEGADVKVTGADYSGKAKDDFDDEFTWNNPDVKKIKEVKVKLEVKPDWDAKGDVVLTAKPRGYEGIKVTILKVTPVAQMKVEEKEVLGGDAKVAVNDIVITETKAGAFKSGTRFGVSLTGLKFEDAKFDTKGTIEAEGINIKDYKLDKDDKTL